MEQRHIDRIQQDWLEEQAVPECLHVGCGEKPIPWAVNIDPNPSRARWIDYAYDVHDLPFADETFDSVVSSHVLPSLEDVDRAMAQMIRVLKVGGHMAHVIPDWRYAPRRCDPRHDWQFQRQGWHGAEDFCPFVERFSDRLYVVELADFEQFKWSFRVIAERL